MKQRFITLIPSSLALLMALSLMLTATQAHPTQHGTTTHYRLTQAVAVTAYFDDGEPMREAQVIVYAPDDPATPWLKGNTDERGQFLFAPDMSQSGSWAVSIRAAGHGEMVHIPLDGEAEAPSTTAPAAVSSGPTPWQTLLMGAAGVWGFIGTALYFSRGKETA